MKKLCDTPQDNLFVFRPSANDSVYFFGDSVLSNTESMSGSNLNTSPNVSAVKIPFNPDDETFAKPNHFTWIPNYCCPSHRERGKQNSRYFDSVDLIQVEVSHHQIKLLVVVEIIKQLVMVVLIKEMLLIPTL